MGAFLNITLNRMLGRTHVPHPRKQLFIETSGRCNLACRFCAYPKREAPGVFMSLDRFRATVDDAVALGYDTIVLTPMLGELFADPTVGEKFRYLENHADIKGYLFYSNFILPDEETVRSLGKLTKLTEIHISVYGHDSESFVAVTRKPVSQHDRLMRNLRVLRAMRDNAGRGPRLCISVRTLGGLRDDNLPDTELTRLLFDLRDRMGALIDVADGYDTWGGTVTDEDVAPIGIKLTEGADIYKYGACGLIFGSVQVRADGSVHACACRDVDGSLLIGDLGKQPLSSIVSSSNTAYTGLIEAQQRGDFLPNCRSCSLYTSIYDGRAANFPSATPFLPLDSAMALLAPAPDAAATGPAPSS